MSASVKKVAEALRKMGEKFAPEDSHLVHVNDRELRMLEKHSGKGVPNPVSGIPQFYDGDTGNGNGDNSGIGGGDSGDDTDGTSDDGWGASFDAAMAEAMAAAPTNPDAANQGYGAPGDPAFDEAIDSWGASTPVGGYPQFDENNPTPSGRGANTGGITSTPTGALADTPGGKAGQGLGGNIDSIVDNYNSNRESWNDEHNGTGQGGFTFDLGWSRAGSTIGGMIGGIPGAIIGGGLIGSIGYDPGYMNDPNNVDYGQYGDASNNEGEGSGGGNSTDDSPWFEVTTGQGMNEQTGQPLSSSDIWNGPVFSGPRYGAYIPASSPASAPISEFPSGSVMFEESEQSPSGWGAGYDAVDFLERQKKEAAIKQALMGNENKPKPMKIPTIDDYLAGKY